MSKRREVNIGRGFMCSNPLCRYFHQNARNYELNIRREKLKQLLREESAQYDKELRNGRIRIQPPSDITKDKMAKKPSDDYSSRAAFLSGDVNSRRKEELAHFSVLPLSVPQPPTITITAPQLDREPQQATTVSQIQQDGIAKNHKLNRRREKLKQLLRDESAQYDKELRNGRIRIQAPSGITKNEMAKKPSDDYSSRAAFLSGDVNCRRKEELAHFSVLPLSVPQLRLDHFTRPMSAPQPDRGPEQPPSPVVSSIQQGQIAPSVAASIQIQQLASPRSARSSRSNSSGASSIMSSIVTGNRRRPNRNHANSPQPGQSVFRFW